MSKSVLALLVLLVPTGMATAQEYPSPTNVTARAVDPWVVELTWTHVAYGYYVIDEGGKKLTPLMSYQASYGSTLVGRVERLTPGTTYTLCVAGAQYGYTIVEPPVRSAPVAVTTPEGPSVANFTGTQTGPGTILWSWDVENAWNGAIPPMQLHGGDLTHPGSPYTITSGFIRSGMHVEVVEKGVPVGDWTRHVALLDPYNQEISGPPCTVNVVPMDSGLKLTVDTTHVSEGRTATFTLTAGEDIGFPTKRVVGYFTEDEKPTVLVGATEGNPVWKTTPFVRRFHVGREFAAGFAVFDAAPPIGITSLSGKNGKMTASASQADEIHGKITELLRQRQVLMHGFQDLATAVNLIDNKALDALAAGRTTVRNILVAGAVGAEKAADGAVDASWATAKNKVWEDRSSKAVIDAWQRLRDRVKPIDEQLWALIQQGEHPVMLKSTAVDIRFLDEETATSRYGSVVTRDLLFVRPAGETQGIRMASSDLFKVEVAMGENIREYGGAAICPLRLTGKDGVSEKAKDIDIQVFAGQEVLATKSMHHTNVDYRDVCLTRKDDETVNKTTFSYDDFKVGAPAGYLVVYVRGTIYPVVSRYAAFRNLRDNLRIAIPAVGDSHAGLAKPLVTLLPRRPAMKYTTPDKQEATIEFAERVTIGGADPLNTAVYNDDESADAPNPGLFVTLFAYKGLPRYNSDFGKKVICVRGMSSVHGALGNVPVGPERKVEYFYLFSGQNHPFVRTLVWPSAINALFYCSREACRANETAVVPTLSWQGGVIGNAPVQVAVAQKESSDQYIENLYGCLGSMGRTPNRSGLIITFYWETIANVSSYYKGFGYAYNETQEIVAKDQNGDTIKSIRDAANGTRTLSLTVSTKRFGDLLAHVWRHEWRHGEQFESLARLNAIDTLSTDKDMVKNLQEDANDTDATDPATWTTARGASRTFPVSKTSTLLDDEVDCELRAAAEVGDTTLDWGMGKVYDDGTRTEARCHRAGTHWKE